jgi:hypothetical protein
MGFTSGGHTTGLGRAQFRKLETVASRLSHCDHFKPLFPAKWIISELPVIRPQLRPALILFTSSCRQEAGLSLIPHHHGGSSF